MNRFLMSGISLASSVADEFFENFSKHIGKNKMRAARRHVH
jgi:hypothetical protein